MDLDRDSVFSLDIMVLPDFSWSSMTPQVLADCRPGNFDTYEMVVESIYNLVSSPI
jgi:hypothetical protein